MITYLALAHFDRYHSIIVAVGTFEHGTIGELQYR
jgi:hypothetical protein